jgi:hypothetical protein
LKKEWLVKTLALGIVVIFISMGAVSAKSAPSNDEVEIRIYAGFLGFMLDIPPMGGSIGFGTSVQIINNGSEPVMVHEQYEYWTLFGKYLGKFGLNYTVPANCTDSSGDFGWPWRAVYLKITVEAGNTTVSRSGFSIFNFVILRK